MELLQAETRKKAYLPVLAPSAAQKENAAEVLISLIVKPRLKYSKTNLPGKIGHAVRHAHTKQGVTQAEFYNNLRIPSPDAKGKPQFICTKAPNPVDTYNSVDVQGWLKYLLYGGQRRIGAGYAEDQDKVMGFFGITPDYKPKRQDPHLLRCNYSYHLQMAIDCRNNLPGHQVGNTYSALDFSDLMLYYYGVMGAFLPFAETVWEDQQFWKDLLTDVKKDFFKGLGKVSYDCSALFDLARIPSDLNSRNLAEKLLKDTAAALTDGSMTYSNHYVAFCGDVGDFAADLKSAWDIAANQRLQDGVEHMIRCICRRCWALDIFDLSPEGLRRMSLALLNALEDTGEAAAMLELGERYWCGIEGAERDGNQAVIWYKKAADIASGTAEASYRLGLCFQSGCDEFEPNLSEAQSWMDRAARLGHATAQVWVGEHCEKEKPEQAFQWFRKAGDQGCAAGHYHLGRCYENGIGTERDDEAAISRYRAAVNAGHKEARYNLALCLPLEGPGVLGKEAEALLQELVKEGHQPAMCALADNHINLDDLITKGDAIGDATAERTRAKDLLMQAAEGGYTPAWIQLGAFYAPYDSQRDIYGRRAQDWETSMECYRKAADAGDPEGYYQLGRVCCRIHGFGKIPTEEALEYFRKAATLGHAGALYTLGIYVLEHDAQNDGEEPFFYVLAEAACLGHKAAGRLAEIFEIRHPDDEPPQWDLLIKELQRQAESDDDWDRDINFAVERYALAHCYFQRAPLWPQTADDDIRRAMYWLEEAARSGSRVAKRELYERTYQDNPAAALNWLRLAAEQGSCEAMRMMYLATCDHDPQGAVEWLCKAAAEGSLSSSIALHHLQQGEPVCFELDPADMHATISDEERRLVEELNAQADSDE